MATNQAATQEYQYLPISLIVITTQVRSAIDTAAEPFLALVASIKLLGILEPLIVMPLDDGTYRLICGERRLLAAQAAGLTEVPVTFIPAGTPEAEITALQITENLQREDLNMIDMANSVLKYLHIKHADLNQDVNGAIGVLTQYKLRPQDLGTNVAPTVGAILKISGKSITTLVNALSLLKLNLEIQAALKDGSLQVSQGYLFASHRDCPDLMKVFESIMATPVTNAVLEKMLIAWKKVKAADDPAEPLSLSKQHKSITTMTTTLTKNMDRYTKDDLQSLRKELGDLCTLIDGKIGAV